MLLPADTQRTGDLARAFFKRHRAIVFPEGVVGKDMRSRIQRLIYGDQRRFVLDLDDRKLGRAARCIPRLCGHGENDLAVKFDLVDREHRVVVLDRGDVFCPEYPPPSARPLRPVRCAPCRDRAS